MLQRFRDFVVRACALLTASALALTVGLTTAPAAAAADADIGVYTGRVVDDSGQPVPGATVDLTRATGVCQ